ncbi:MAG: hypothetical protein M3320_10585 [Actinomycetota bacterium]|nr:hypothetical protein [Actinomycetota bacterium]MDQ5809110.1 hypothetical protein [Actinomycetota bacterium]
MAQRLEVRIEDLDLSDQQVAELEEAIGRAVREVAAGWGSEPGAEATGPRVEAAEEGWSGFRLK